LEKLLAEKGPRPFLPKRWIVERTLAWLGQNRRPSKDYERLPERPEKPSSTWRDESLDGEEIGSLLRLFGQFQGEVRRIPSW
jgi:hypothetical protein